MASGAEIDCKRLKVSEMGETSAEGAGMEKDVETERFRERERT